MKKSSLVALHVLFYPRRSEKKAKMTKELSSFFRKFFIILIYIVFFWFFLPAALIRLGRAVDAFLGIHWQRNLWSYGCAGILWVVGGGILLWSIGQLWWQGKGLPISHLPPRVFVAKGLYRLFRHPIYIGFTLAFAALSISLASWGSLVFSTPLLLLGWVAYTAYLEEPALLRRFGEAYRDYQKRVGLFFPVPLGLARWRFFSAHAPLTVLMRWRYAMVVFFLYALWIALYTGIGAHVSTLPTHTLFLPFEDRLPFLPQFEFIYLLCYIIPILPLFVAQDQRQLHRLFFCWLGINLLAFTMFLIFPVYRPRPFFEINTFATYLLSLEYATDRPVNNFPSLHAAFSMLIFLGCRGWRRWLDGLLAFLVIGIGLGAVFIRQHYLLDILAGDLLALAIWWISAALFFSGCDDRREERA
jgi:protein-S-isoprenylcysteine O-methyltransferase Ste14